MIQPVRLAHSAYTDKGNNYTVSNYGKFAAGTSIAVGATTLGSKYAIKGLKNMASAAKTIKMHLPKFSKPNFKTLFTAIPTKLAKAAKSIKDFSLKGFNLVKSNVKKLSGLKKYANSGIEFVKSHTPKIKMPNIKNVLKSITNLGKKPVVLKGAGIVSAFAGIFATGSAIDFAVNKINEYKADHKKVILK